MSNNFITNSKENKSLKERLQKLISASIELKFLVGFFYFSGWQEIYKSLKENNNVVLKILVGLQVDKYLSGIIEVENKDDSLSREEHFSQFIKSLPKIFFYSVKKICIERFRLYRNETIDNFVL